MQVCDLEKSLFSPMKILSEAKPRSANVGNKARVTALRRIHILEHSSAITHIKYTAVENICTAFRPTKCLSISVNGAHL